MEKNELVLNEKQKSKLGKKSNFATKRKKEILFLIALLAFPVVHKIVFYIGGNINSFTLAFQRYDGELQKFVWTGFDNFRDVFNDLKYSVLLRTGIKNTLWLYLMNTFLSIPISLFCSYFVVKKVPGHDFLKVVFFLPSLVSGVVMMLMYKYFCEYALPEVVMSLFKIDMPLILSEYPYAYPMMLLYSLWTGFAGGIIMYVGNMSKIPEGVADAAQIDGVSVMGEFWHITMPAVYPLLTVYLVTGLTGMFTGGGPIFTFYQYSAPKYCYTTGYFLFNKVMSNSATLHDYPYPAAVGMLVTLVAAPLTFLLRWGLEKFGPSED